MKKDSRNWLFCSLGLVAVITFFCLLQPTTETDASPSTKALVLLKTEKPKAKPFEWRQPLLHPTYPPKLVPGEKEFVLK